MWNNNRPRGSSFRQSKKPQQPQAVGTEALAKENRERNAKDFCYPSTGFVTPIEYTLLYAILSVPNIYPEQVMLETIREQNFNEFLRVKPPSTSTIEEPIYSYAQCSALLYLAAERWPSPPPPPVADEQASFEAQKKSVPQTLCRSVLQTVVRHAERHDLDREAEVRELLEPLRVLNAKKINKVNLALLAPMYIGLGASIVTGLAGPLWIGYLAAGALATKQAPSKSEITNMGHVAEASQRMADEHTTSLLDGMEDHSGDHYDDDY